jgi:hypothetical protein
LKLFSVVYARKKQPRRLTKRPKLTSNSANVQTQAFMMTLLNIPQMFLLTLSAIGFYDFWGKTVPKIS